MSIRKSAAERREETEYKSRRDEWTREMYLRGIRVIGRAERTALEDVVSLLALSCRRFPTPFDFEYLQSDCLRLYQEAKKELDATATWSDFEHEDRAPDDGKVIYFPKVNG
jgi:hypothetical protein